MMISAQDRPDPQPAADTYEKFKVGMAGYTFVNFDLDKTLQTLENAMSTTSASRISSAVQQHRPTDCRFPREIEIEGSYRLCRGTDLHETEQEIDNAFEYAKRVGVKLIVGVPNYDLLPYLDKR